MLGRPRRIALLAEGLLTPLDAKTAIGVLRYRGHEVVAAIDSTRAGRTVRECLGCGLDQPVVAGVAEAAAVGADTLLIGVAPRGGELPERWRGLVLDALARGWDVMSGLHDFLADDAGLAAAARASGATIHDVRRPPQGRPIATRRAAHVDAQVVLTVGSDCNVGKMTCALELRAALESRGTRAAFVATGQTGIFVADQGVAVDAVPSDFVAGHAEAMVVAAARDADVVLVEGQGALAHPAYSGVTLALLHGSCPSALVLCHHAGRERVRGGASEGEPLIPPLDRLVEVYEEAAAWVHPARVTGVAINTLGLDDSAAHAAVDEAARITGRPATDPIRFGCGPLVEALERERREGRRASVA